MTKFFLKDNAPDSCTCTGSTGHWGHVVDCAACDGRGTTKPSRIKWIWLQCNDCYGTGRLETCYCGARVRRIYGAGCAIATASLGTHAEGEIALLKTHRDEVVEAGAIGTLLSEAYNRLKCPVAAYLEDKPFLKTTFLYPFVYPILHLLRTKQAAETREEQWLADAAVFVLLIGGLLWTSIVYLAAAVSVKRI